MSTRVRPSSTHSSSLVRKRKPRLSAGWTDERIQKVIDFYDSQTDADSAAEIEAALKAPETMILSIPKVLVPAVKRLIARNTALRAEALRVVRGKEPGRERASRPTALRKPTPRKSR